jgi:hypothetical protein
MGRVPSQASKMRIHIKAWMAHFIIIISINGHIHTILEYNVRLRRLTRVSAYLKYPCRLANNAAKGRTKESRIP